MKALLLSIAILSAMSFRLEAQSSFPDDVELVLKKADKNRSELGKFINHFNKEKDSLKYKAACFLIANMDIHMSENYYWADSTGKEIKFEELNYPDFNSSIKAFDSLKNIYKKIHPVAYSYNDIDTLRSDFLIKNLNDAFYLWHQSWAKDITFNDFCEYLLPYRISVEPVQQWRNIYKDRFRKTIEKYEDIDSALFYMKKDLNYWFTCTYNLEKRADPIPRLGALQLLLRKKGPCEDVADLGVFALRSQGIPASIDYVPAWATSSGNHTLNVALDYKGKPIHYDLLLTSDSLKDFIREPAKVLRSLYSKQKNTLANYEKMENIPAGFLRSFNYKDVTEEYWKTANVVTPLYSSKIKNRIAYAAVLNYGKWESAWWGFVKNDSVVFDNMCKGAVFLPVYYSNGKLTPAGYPIANGYDNSRVIIPDTLHPISLTIKEQEHYLRFRSGKKYKFYYWDDRWRLLGEKTTAENTKELIFDNVPRNALYILIPEYTQRKERPFTINENGQREWW